MTVARSIASRIVTTALALAVGAGLVAGTLAIAAPPGVTVVDQDDVLGHLDIRRVTLDTATGGPEWTTVTFSPWTPWDLWDRGYVLVYLDTTGTPRGDYYALIRSTGHALVGSLWRDRSAGGDVRLRSLQVTKGSGAAVTVRVPTGQLSFDAARTSYGWWVVTMFTGRWCRRTCVDRVPDVGPVVQPLPTPTPTQTPTPSPTDTTTPSPSPS